MNRSQQYADRLWLALDLAQIPSAVVHTGSGEYSVDVPVSLGGLSLTLEMTCDQDGLVWQFRTEDGPLMVGGSRAGLAAEDVAAWVHTLLAHLGGRLDELFFKVSESVLVGDLDSRQCITVVQVLEVAGEVLLMGDRDARRWPAATAVHAVPVADRRAGASTG